MYSLFFIEGVFKSHLTKITATQSANSHPKSQFDQGPYYINVLKNGSAPPSPRGREGGCELRILSQPVDGRRVVSGRIQLSLLVIYFKIITSNICYLVLLCQQVLWNFFWLILSGYWWQLLYQCFR